jgi:hypothetical protein
LIPRIAAYGDKRKPRRFPCLPARRMPRRIFPGLAPMNDLRASAVAPVRATERRQRNRKVDTRWDDLEYASLVAAAQATGLTRAAYIRALVLGNAGPRSQRAPSFEAHALAHATAALNKIGSNLNQIARALNAAGADVTTRECVIVLGEVRTAVACVLDIAGRRVRP